MKEVFEVKKTPTFDVGQTLDCGQVFRFVAIDGGFRILAGRHCAEIFDLGDAYRFECDDADFFKRYFDFDTDYQAVQAKCEDGGTVSNAIEFGRGIHILRQDPIETIFSFIISQNNHIPRIKGIIERICDALGEDMGGYHAFPTVEALASVGEEFYAKLGAGYRAAYLDSVAKALQGVNVNEWNALSTDDLRAKLLALHGVGRKVADCVLLFGFNRFDVFPVDTWIKKVFEQEFENVPADKMATLLIQKYGQYAGFVQQWLFFFKRNEKKV